MSVRVVEPDAALLERFYRGIYLADFGPQREPLEAWTWALWSGEAPYRMMVRVALAADGDEIVGGIAYELYPRSRCGLVTYMVVAPAARGAGLGRRLQGDAARALFAGGARAVFGEVSDPRVPHGHETAAAAWERLERNQKWGARVVDARYVQPALGPGLERDRGLVLIALRDRAPLPATMPGAIVRDFVAELFAATERTTDQDAELREILDGIASEIALIELRPPA